MPRILTLRVLQSGVNDLLIVICISDFPYNVLSLAGVGVAYKAYLGLYVLSLIPFIINALAFAYNVLGIGKFLILFIFRGFRVILQKYGPKQLQS